MALCACSRPSNERSQIKKSLSDERKVFASRRIKISKEKTTQPQNGNLLVIDPFRLELQMSPEQFQNKIDDYKVLHAINFTAFLRTSKSNMRVKMNSIIKAGLHHLEICL
jgi:hypothetical protein